MEFSESTLFQLGVLYFVLYFDLDFVKTKLQKELFVSLYLNHFSLQSLAIKLSLSF